MAASLRTSWQKTVRADPAAVALYDAETARSWTRTELNALGQEWAARHGAQAARQRVVFAEPNGSEWFRVFLGLVACDGVVVALDPGEPPAAQRAIAESIGATFIWRAGQLEQLPPRRRALAGTRLLKVTSGTTGVPR